MIRPFRVRQLARPRSAALEENEFSGRQGNPVSFNPCSRSSFLRGASSCVVVCFSGGRLYSFGVPVGLAAGEDFCAQGFLSGFRLRVNLILYKGLFDCFCFLSGRVGCLVCDFVFC